jgi:hypothetical protein
MAKGSNKSFYCKQEKGNGSPRAETLDREQVQLVSSDRLDTFVVYQIDTMGITASLDQMIR